MAMAVTRYIVTEPVQFAGRFMGVGVVPRFWMPNNALALPIQVTPEVPNPGLTTVVESDGGAQAAGGVQGAIENPDSMILDSPRRNCASAA